MQQEDQHIDLPDLRHEGQKQGDRGAEEIERDEHRPPRQALGESGCDRRDADIGDHLDGEGAAENRASVDPRKIEGEQSERDRREAGADEGDHLRREEMTVSAVGEDLQHRAEYRRDAAAARPPLKSLRNYPRMPPPYSAAVSSARPKARTASAAAASNRRPAIMARQESPPA